MVRLRSGYCTHVRLHPQAPGSCCPSRPQAASKGHYECYQLVLPEERKHSEYQDLYPCLSLALRHGNMDFARRLFCDRRVAASDFADFCAVKGDTVCLQYMLGICPVLDLAGLRFLSVLARSADCLRMLLERGAPWQPKNLLYPAQHNRLDILDVVLKHSKEWSSHLPSVAGAAGNVCFLMRAFDAGCPVWTTAQDGEPRLYDLNSTPPGLYPPKEKQVGSGWRFLRMEPWSLVVSSDLVLSGPVLLYAAQKGAFLTPRMQGMLGDVRRRALALAGCFHRAACLSKASGAAARTWGSMGKVPVDLVRRIATMARISIVEFDLVQ